jgi:hypothetical protein
MAINRTEYLIDPMESTKHSTQMLGFLAYYQAENPQDVKWESHLDLLRQPDIADDVLAWLEYTMAEIQEVRDQWLPPVLLVL